MVAILTKLASAASVEAVRFAPSTQLTPAVARAVSRVSPKLTCLDFRWYVQHEDTTGVPTAVELLLQLVGPQLRDLGVHIFDGSLPARTLESLVHCSALTKLEISNDHYYDEPEAGLAAESSMLRTISRLTSLRDLTLTGGARPPFDMAVRQARAAGLESCLSPLTALTRLDVRLHCLHHVQHPVPYLRDSEETPIHELEAELRLAGRQADAARLMAATAAEWRALVAAARRMPQLSVLRSPARADVADLAGLTALTYLRAGAILLPGSLQDTVAPGPPSPRPSYELPPLLRRLVVYAPVSVHVVAALRRAPAAVAGAGPPAVSWEAPGLMGERADSQWSLEFHSADVDLEGRLTAETVGVIHQAVATLKTVFAPVPTSEQGYTRAPCIELYGKSLEWVLPPVASPAEAMAAGGGGGGGLSTTHCGSWLGAMMAELRPQTLKLWGFTLAARDMLGLARLGGGVKRLDLAGCTYSVSSLPLLSGLAALEKLNLRAENWLWPPASSPSYEAAVVEAAFLALAAPVARVAADCGEGPGGADGGEEALYECAAALPLPRLKRVTVYCESDPVEAMLQEGLTAAMAELMRRRPVAAQIIVGRF